MGVYGLDRIFQPASVAIVGASDKKGTIGYSLTRNIIDGGFVGKVFPVNLRYKSVAGKSYIYAKGFLKTLNINSV